MQSGDLGVSGSRAFGESRVIDIERIPFSVYPWPMWSWRSTRELRPVFESLR
ncbi:MAG: hypothetical protein Ct9H300mP32_1710 [Verrucomicrobiota bacterium]|nr:MAG: hypothetical protein Ct9H300mP32_1710 [Verrucomicrobiota bacterium]